MSQFCSPDVRREIIAHRNYAKVFGVGQNKTGTTSLEVILRFYGFHLPNQHEQEAFISKSFFMGNYAPFKDFVAKFDAFQDLPFSQGNSYIVADTLFPGSRFVLTEREPEAWYNSMCNFHAKTYGIEDIKSVTEEDIKKLHYLYEGYAYFVTQEFLTTVEDGEVKVRWDLLYDEEFYISQYTKRNDEIKLHFKDRPDQLLVIDVTKETDTTKICEFLGIPAKYAVAMPHANKT